MKQRLREGREPAQGTTWREGSNNGVIDLSNGSPSGLNHDGIDIEVDQPFNYASRNGFYTNCTVTETCGPNTKNYWTHTGRIRGNSVDSFDPAAVPTHCDWVWEKHNTCMPNWAAIAPELQGTPLPPPAAATAGNVGGALNCSFYGNYVAADDLPATKARTDVLWVFAQMDLNVTYNNGIKQCVDFICPSLVRYGAAPQYYSRQYYGMWDDNSKYNFFIRNMGAFYHFYQAWKQGDPDIQNAIQKLKVKPLFGIQVSNEDTGGSKFTLGYTADPVYKLLNGGDSYVAGFRGIISAANVALPTLTPPSRPSPLAPGWPDFEGFRPLADEFFYAPIVATNTTQLKWTLHGLSNPWWASGNQYGFDNSLPNDITDDDRYLTSTSLGGQLQSTAFSQETKDMATMKCCNGEWTVDEEILHCPPNLFPGSLGCNAGLNDIGKTDDGKYKSICPRYVKSDSVDFIGWDAASAPEGSSKHYWLTRCGCQLDPLFYADPNVPPECFDKRCISQDAYKDYAKYSKGCTKQDCTINLGNVYAKNGSEVNIAADNKCCIAQDGAKAGGRFAGADCTKEIASGGYRCAPAGTAERQCIRDSTNGLVSAASCMEKCGADPLPMYKCNAGACTQAPDGTYASMAECQAGCAVPGVTKFGCVNGAACAPSPTGTFDSIALCQASGCGAGVQSKYACVDGSCVPNAAGAFTSQALCESAGCGAGVQSKYACVDGSCVPNAAGAFTSQALCESAGCYPPAPPPGGSSIGVIIGASVGGLVLVVGGVMLARRMKYNKAPAK